MVLSETTIDVQPTVDGPDGPVWSLRLSLLNEGTFIISGGCILNAGVLDGFRLSDLAREMGELYEVVRSRGIATSRMETERGRRLLNS